MSNSGRTIWRSFAALAFTLIFTGSMGRAQTMRPQQRLSRALKSGNIIDVWTALREVAPNAVANSGVTDAAQSDNASDKDCRDDRHCPKIITIDPPGSVLTILVAINDDGVIAGNYVDSAGTVRMFLREKDSTYVAVDPPGIGTGPGSGGIIWSINHKGDVTGSFGDQAGVTHAYLRTHDGKYTQIDVEGAGPLCCTLGLNINEEDEIAGEYVDTSLVAHGYVRRRNGTVEEFSQPGAGGTGCSSHACGTVLATTDGFNSEGDVAGGYYDNSNASHGLLRFRGGDIVVFDADGAGSGPIVGTF
jgi:hypothetical protein